MPGAAPDPPATLTKRSCTCAPAQTCQLSVVCARSILRTGIVGRPWHARQDADNARLGIAVLHKQSILSAQCTGTVLVFNAQYSSMPHTQLRFHPQYRSNDTHAPRLQCPTIPVPCYHPRYHDYIQLFGIIMWTELIPTMEGCLLRSSVSARTSYPSDLQKK